MKCSVCGIKVTSGFLCEQHKKEKQKEIKDERKEGVKGFLLRNKAEDYFGNPVNPFSKGEIKQKCGNCGEMFSVTQLQPVKSFYVKDIQVCTKCQEGIDVDESEELHDEYLAKNASEITLHKPGVLT